MVLDASYSYGSFNTHKSCAARFGQIFKNGFMYESERFSEFFDNDYVDTYVRDFEIREDSVKSFPSLDKK